MKAVKRVRRSGANEGVVHRARGRMGGRLERDSWYTKRAMWSMERRRRVYSYGVDQPANGA
jgi:hypothetical protein